MKLIKRWIVKKCKVVMPEWISSGPNAVQSACDICPPGGRVVLTKTYSTNPIVLGPEHSGIAIVGLGSPLSRFVEEGNGAALQLINNANDHVISIVGTRGERVSITLDGFKIDGNKGKNSRGCGLRMFQIKDVFISRLYIEDCAEHGLEVGEEDGDTNQLIVDYLEVQRCNGKGLNLSVLADSNFNVCTVADSGGIGAFISGSNLKFGRLRAYYNGEQGVNIGGTNCFVSELHANENNYAGVRIVGDRNRIVAALCYNNGKNPRSSQPGDVAGIDIHGSACKNWIGHAATYDDQTGTQSIGIHRSDGSESDNTIGVEVTGV